MNLLEFENVNYYYGKGLSYETHALTEINLQIGYGEFIGLIGPTGSGKSTLLMHMNGINRPDSGRVLLEGTDLQSRQLDRRKICSKVGLVFQYPENQLFGETVLMDAAFGPRNLGRSEEEAQQAARRALELTGLPPECYDKSPYDLSGGEKRRAAIAGILAMEPQLLVLDEPAAGLDAFSRRSLMDLFQRMVREKGITVVLSSHSMEEMAQYAGRILVMKEGSIVRDGKPEEIFSEEAFLSSMGLRAPQMYYVMDRLRSRGIPVRRDCFTPQQAAQEILRLWKGEQS